jgi:hypothetical protein
MFNGLPGWGRTIIGNVYLLLARNELDFDVLNHSFNFPTLIPLSESVQHIFHYVVIKIRQFRLVWLPGQNKRITPLSFFQECRKR